MRIRVEAACAAVLVLLAASVAVAQSAKTAPSPGPQVKKLAAYVGKWNVEANVPPDAMGGSGGKTTGTLTCEWVADGYGVLCRENIPIPGAEPLADVYLMAYDDEAKNYYFCQVNVGGGVMAGRGTLDGDTWTWTVNSSERGKDFHMRFTEKFTSADVYEFKNEFAFTTDAMKVVMEGKETRVKGAAEKPAGE